MRSPLDPRVQQHGSRRYFERNLRELQQILERRVEFLRGLQAELADDSYFSATEDARARIGEALTQLSWAAGSLEAAREQLP